MDITGIAKSRHVGIQKNGKGIIQAVRMLGNARQGIGYGFHRYVGPKPPKGKKHTYRFTVYLENLQRLLGQLPVPEDGEFSEEDIDKYVFGVRVYEDRFEWLLNLSPEARGELDDAGSPVYFTKLTVTPDDTDTESLQSP